MVRTFSVVGPNLVDVFRLFFVRTFSVLGPNLGPYLHMGAGLWNRNLIWWMFFAFFGQDIFSFGPKSGGCFSLFFVRTFSVLGPNLGPYLHMGAGLWNINLIWWIFFAFFWSGHFQFWAQIWWMFFALFWSRHFQLWPQIWAHIYIW